MSADRAGRAGVAPRSLWSLLVAALAALAMCATSGNADAGTPGSWGPGAWPYGGGVVCTSITGRTIPLVAWQVGADPAFLLGGISETAGVDSGHPPTAPTSDTSFVPGTHGLADAATVAAAAYLISTWGDGTDRQVAEVAEILAGLNGDTDGPACLATGTGGTSTSDADAMWARSRQLAGPYRVALTADTPTVHTGQLVNLTARVLSAAGQPVPGLVVTFGVGSSSTTATTGDDGRAVAGIGAGTFMASQPVTFTAAVRAPTTLILRTSPGAVAAVQPGPATTVSAALPVPVDGHAAPTISTSLPAHVVRAGTALVPTLSVAGLNGHAATATLTVLGPLPVDATGGCQLSDAAWTQAFADNPALSRSVTTIQLSGDQQVLGSPITSSLPGCYTTGGSLATTDATPAVTARAEWGSTAGSAMVSSVAAAILIAPGGVGSAAGPSAVAVVVSASSGAHGTVNGVIRGPLDAVAGSCSGLTWTSAPVAVRISAAPLTGDGTDTIARPQLAVGCYALDASVDFDYGSLGQLAIHPSIGSTGSVALFLAPTLAVHVGQTGIDAGLHPSATVTVLGSLRQPGTGLAQLLWLPASPQGCDSVDWSTARASTAPSTTIHTSGDGTYSLPLSAVPKSGCYSVALTLTLDGNHAVTAVSPQGQRDSLFVAGPAAPAAFRPAASDGSDEFGPRLWTTLIATLLVVGAAVGRVLRLAWQHHQDGPRHGKHQQEWAYRQGIGTA